LLGKEVGQSIEQSMMDRRSINLIADAKKNLQGILLEEVIELEEYFYNGLLVPIIAQGDPIGTVVIGSKTDLGDTESKVAQSMAGVLAKQMEL
jgi:AbrB family transcriptional regulator, stage V sporulation protein T